MQTPMQTLETVISLEAMVLLGALAALLGYWMLIGKINVQGLLSDKSDGSLSPGRVQLLILTLSGALFYLGQVFHDPSRLPNVPPELLLIIGGSHVVYLGGKSLPILGSWFNPDA